MTVTDKIIRILLLYSLLFLFAGCGTPLRYSHTIPAAKDFKPERIVVFPANAVVYPEQAGNMEKIAAEALSDRRWFSRVITADAVKKLVDTDAKFKKVYTEYISKLKEVSFSDPDLSKQIGEQISADAFLWLRIDYWNYAKEGDDKVAKVGLDMKLIDAVTGMVVWKAAHEEVRNYKVLKPDLSNIAKSLTKDMISHMPHGTVK